MVAWMVWLAINRASGVSELFFLRFAALAPHFLLLALVLMLLSDFLRGVLAFSRSFLFRELQLLLLVRMLLESLGE